MSTSAVAARDDRLPHRRSEAVLIDVEPEELTFHTLGGRPCLDFVATIGERWRRGFERLRTPTDLARWVEARGLVASPPRVTAADLERSRQVRGAIARVVMAWGTGEPLPPDDVDLLNTVAAQPDLAPHLSRDGTADSVEGTIRAALSTLARDAITLVATGDPRRLRECGADDCSLLFYDDSRPGSRRWCSMAGCGNRHKTSQYRRRQGRQPDRRP